MNEKRENLEVVKIKEELRNTNKPLLIMGGGMLISAILGYIAGGRYTELKIDNGLNKCFKVDPNLESSLKAAIEKLNNYVSIF